MEYQYTYFFMALLFFIVWLLLFLWRKDTRKEMLVMSFVLALGGPISDILYTQDWWRPITLTYTRIGPESLIVGFMIGGISAVIYEDFFKKRIKIRKVSKNRKGKENLSLVLILSLLIVLFFGSFYLFKFNSLLATSFAFLIPTFLIWIKRKDLIVDSLFTGVVLVIVACFVYSALEFLTPGWIQAFWYFKNVPNVVFFNLPLDDIIWYFLAGLFIAPLYEFWKEETFIAEK